MKILISTNHPKWMKKANKLRHRTGDKVFLGFQASMVAGPVL